MLEDLEVFMAVEVVVEEEGAKDACLARSWSPGLGRPTLVAPVFIMAACQQTTPGKIPEQRGNHCEWLFSRKMAALMCHCMHFSTAEQLPLELFTWNNMELADNQPILNGEQS